MSDSEILAVEVRALSDSIESSFIDISVYSEEVESLKNSEVDSSLMENFCKSKSFVKEPLKSSTLI
jgi:hypothetical protein